MAVINFKHTDVSGKTHINSTYQCSYPSMIYHDDPSKEIVYIIAADPVAGTMLGTQHVQSSSEAAEYTFNENLIYFITVKDFESMTSVIDMYRVYKTGTQPDYSSYAIRADNKGKLHVLTEAEQLDAIEKLVAGTRKYCQVENNTEYTNNGFIINPNIGNTITIPKGVTRIKVTGCYSDLKSAVNTNTLTISKNNMPVIKGYETVTSAGGGYYYGTITVTKIIPVNEGDVITMSGVTLSNPANGTKLLIVESMQSNV